MQATEKTDTSAFQAIATEGLHSLHQRSFSPTARSFTSNYGVKLWLKHSNESYEETKYGLPRSFELYFDELKRIALQHPSLKNDVIHLLTEMDTSDWDLIVYATVKKEVKELLKEMQGEQKKVII